MQKRKPEQGESDDNTQKKSCLVRAPKKPVISGYWLMKSEPDCFSIDDLIKRPNSTETWDGVRNRQAMGFLKDGFKNGHQALFYHSSCKTPGAVGVVDIVTDGYPDPTQFNPKHKYYDATSKKESPKWYTVDVRFARKLKKPVLLSELRKHEKGDLSTLMLFTHNRLSVIPVQKEEWDYIIAMSEK